jgi:phage baseplate assembly protein gpV
VDDTPGAERLRTAHKSGTFFEVSADGRKVELIVGDGYKYIKGGLTLTVDNNSDIMLSGNLKLVVQGDLHAEVHGDMDSVVSGDATVATVGNMVAMIGGDAYTKVDGTMSAKVDGNINATTGADAEIQVGGSVAVVAGGDINLDASKVNIKGDLAVQGKIDATKDIVGMNKSLATHIHTGVQSGPATSGPPQ